MKKTGTNMRKGQMTIPSIIMAVVSLIIFLALLPVVNQVISDHSGDMDAMTLIIVELFPLIIILCIVGSIVFYSRAHYQE